MSISLCRHTIFIHTFETTTSISCVESVWLFRSLPLSWKFNSLAKVVRMVHNLVVYKTPCTIIYLAYHYCQCVHISHSYRICVRNTSKQSWIKKVKQFNLTFGRTKWQPPFWELRPCIPFRLFFSFVPNMLSGETNYQKRCGLERS